MEPTTINGLPAHVLFVHFVVVLVPLAAILLLLSICWPAARRRLGIITPLVALIALIIVPITTQAGEWLQHHTAPDPLIRAHAKLGDGLLFWSIGMLAVASAWWLIHDERFTAWLTSRSSRVRTPSVGRSVTIALAAVAVVIAIGSIVQVYRIGDSGAQAAWHDQMQSAVAAQR